MRILACLFLIVWAVVPNQAHAASFNGAWKVSRVGYGCTPTGLITVNFKKGKITGSYRGGSGRHIAKGTIASSGQFRFDARSPRDIVVFKGKIAGKSGTGTWYVSGRSCRGTLKIFK